MARATGSWVGWDGGAADLPQKVPGMPIRMRSVNLSRPELNGYYHGFSNRTIWPLFHDLIQPARFERSWWRQYVQVNERFAKRTAEALKRLEDPVVWIQDYHLLLVPGLLREISEAPISFFLHIPWPPPELFTRLPWRAEIIQRMLGADVISFHTERYRNNFVRTCGRVLPDLQIQGRKIKLPDGHVTSTSAHPISIDVEDFATTAGGAEVDAELNKLRRQFEGRHVFLGVDRLDYTKGIPERLEAFELFLERRPDLRSKVVLVQIAVPSRSSVREYRELRERVEQSVGRINGRFTEPGHDVPVHYLHRGVSRARLIAFYRLADVMVVTPLKDGMNLVCKEYVACQSATSGTGTLILSEFAGASLELKEALPCNPFDTEGLAQVFEEAHRLPVEERVERLSTMGRYLARHDVHRWVRDQMADVNAARER
jgi:trehalose 6-phosphate synthase